MLKALKKILILLLKERELFNGISNYLEIYLITGNNDPLIINFEFPAQTKKKTISLIRDFSYSLN